ncbi:MAG: hypothetical protein DRQ48_05875 [Gammaproteobacteria bacterium]|nr:MAG: hypothetical protein DRQ58_10690 [Gammaproteobacteria bacterium]RKZ70681.1 MAG: hypothetical protein DRQ48_05875 [Gammaproteobacteria bacterium]
MMTKKITIGGKSFEFNIEFVDAIIEHMDGIQKCEDMKAELTYKLHDLYILSGDPHLKALANMTKVEMK